jgi:hypothetical protein
MTTDTSKITQAANDLSSGLTKGGTAAKTLGAEIANVFVAQDATLTALEARVAALENVPPVEPPIEPPPVEEIPPADHPYEDFTTYYAFPTGTVIFPDNNTVRCQVARGDHATWDASCDFAGLSGPNFAAGSNIHIDYHFKIEAGADMTGRWVICGEIHNDDGALGRATSPPFSIHFDKDHLSIVAIAGGTSGSNDQWMWPYNDPNKVQRDHDYHFRVDVCFTKTGYLKVTRDGEVLLDYHGNIGYGAPTYWMPDIYRSNTNPTTTETTAVVFTKMQVWTD